MSTTPTTILSPSRTAEATPRFSDFLELTKPRLSLMSVVSAILGYFAAGPQTDYSVFLTLAAGTALAAFGAAALNQWLERDADARMRRTADRPTAAGRVSPSTALGFGLVLSIGGVGLLWWGTNAVASLLTAATVVLYIAAYTPMKKVSPLATELGAIPGALPPLIGWIAAGAGFSTMGWTLFALLFAWQIPHFMAISWTCRDDYRNAGFRTLSVLDAEGRRVALKSLVWTILLIGISFLPVIQWSEIGWMLGVVAGVLGLYMLVPAIAFLRRGDRAPAARRLFFASIAYLPLYLSALVVDRFFF